MLAVCALAALVLAVMLGMRPDPDRRKLIAQPSVVEEFRKSYETRGRETTTSPLVVQAQNFGVRIDPPSPKTEDTPAARSAREAIREMAAPPPPPAAFTVVATCVNPADPSQSFALLNQPGKGTFWVRPKDEVNRAVIKEILSGKIVTSDGREFSVPRTERISLLKPGSPMPPGYENYRLPPAEAADMAPSRIAPTIGAPAVAGQPALVQPTVAAEPAAAARAVTPEEAQANVEWLKQLMEDPESMGLTKEEAAQLGDLGQMLKDLSAAAEDTAPTTQDANSAPAGRGDSSP